MKAYSFAMVPEDDISFFKSKGYLIVRDLFSDKEVHNLKKWSREVHDWVPKADSDFMPYEVRISFQFLLLGESYSSIFGAK